jgi:hypothetical protein
LAPSASQRSHWNVYEVGDPVHFPVDAVSSAPSRTVPEIVGGDVFDGAAGTVAVFAVVAVVLVVVVAVVAAEPSATEAASPAPAMQTTASALPTFTFPPCSLQRRNAEGEYRVAIFADSLPARTFSADSGIYWE